MIFLSNLHLITASLIHVNAVEVSFDKHGFYPRNYVNSQIICTHRHYRVDTYWK